MRRVTAVTLLATAIAGFGLAAPAIVRAAPTQTRDIRADRRATAESIAAQYAAEQFRAARIGDETTQRLLADNDAQRRRVAAVLKDAQATKAQRDAARAQLKTLDAQLTEVNGKLLASEQAGEELRAQVREYQRQITDAVDTASPEVLAAYELYAQGDRDTAYEVIDRLSQIEAAAAKRAGEIRAGALLRRPAVLAMDRKDRGEMTVADVIAAWQRAQAGDAEYHRGWIDLTNLQMEAGRLADARKSAEEALRTSETDVDRAISAGIIGDTLLAAGDTNGARTRWTNAVADLAKIPAAAEDFDKAQEATMALLDRLGDLADLELDHAGAAQNYVTELTIARQRAAAKPGDLRAQRDLEISLAKIADAYASAEDYANARKSLDELLAISRQVLATAPGNLAYQRELAMAELKLADFHTDRGELAAARPLAADSLAISRRLSEADPTNATARRDLSVALMISAKTLDETQDGQKAYRALVTEALTLRRALAAADPGNLVAQQDIAGGLNEFGERLANTGDLAGARAAFEEQSAIYRRAAAAQTSYGHDQRRLGVSLASLAEIAMAQNDAPAAKAYLDEMLALRRKLVEQNPTSALVRQDLGLGLLQAGHAAILAEDWSGARSNFTEAQATLDKALNLDSSDRLTYRSLGVAYQGLGQAAFGLRDSAAMSENFKRAGAVFDRLAETYPTEVATRRDVWALLYNWALLVDDGSAWAQTVTEMDAAKAAGLLTPDDEKYRQQAQDRARELAGAVAPVQPPAPSPAPQSHNP